MGDHVIVDLALAQDIMLTRDSQVVIRNVGLMGEKVIAVDLKATGAPYTPRDTIPGDYEMGMPEVMARRGRARSTWSTELAPAPDDSLDRGRCRSGELDNDDRELRGAPARSCTLAVAENRAALRGTMENFAAASRPRRR